MSKATLEILHVLLGRECGSVRIPPHPVCHVHPNQKLLMRAARKLEKDGLVTISTAFGDILAVRLVFPRG